MKPSPDPVDEALELLRADARVELPSPALEQRLRGLHAARRPVRRTRLVAAVILLGSVAGGAFAAGGGMQRLRAWWFHVVIDGVEESGAVVGDGERDFTYTAADGTAVQVHVSRRQDPEGAPRTGIRVYREDPRGSVEEDEVELSPDPAAPQPFPVAALEGLRPLHVWSDTRGRSLGLYLVPDPQDARRTGIVLREFGASGPEAVRCVGSAARSLAELRSVSLEEEAGGGVRLTLEDRGGWVHVLGIQSAGTASQPAGFETPDGRVHVSVED